MKIPLFIILILYPLIVASGPTYDIRSWKKLLHYGSDGSRVVSTEFFLSPEGSYNYLAELDKTIQLLNSQHGQEIACNYPARYQWIKYSKLPVPDFDIKLCKELNEFKNSLQTETISLVFASEYLDNPVSSFGHTLLLFHDRDKPLPSADAIHFAAKTDESDSFISYTWKGLTGGYPGYFYRDPFFKKQFQYSDVEQRYLHIYTLDLSEGQIDRIVNHLYELRKATYKYYFINENCAYQIGNLLDIASDDVSFSDSGFVLPIEVIKKFRKSYVDYRVLPPTSAKIKYLLDRLSQIERQRFANVIAGDLRADESFSDRLKQALAIYYEYDFRKNRKADPHYSAVMQLQYTPVSFDMPSPQPLNKQAASRLAVSYLAEDDQDSLLISYRPFLQDILDIQLENQPEFELSLFNTVIQYKDDGIASLYRFDIASIKSMAPRSQYFKPASWQFYTGLNRQNPTAELNYEAEFGLGLTYTVGIASMNIGLNLGADLTTGDYYYKPQTALIFAISAHLKLGLTASEKNYPDGSYIERRAFVSFSHSTHGFNIQYKTTSVDQGDAVELSVFHYF